MKYILVIDSGIGGLIALNFCKEIMPYENFIFFKDSKNLPYGNKSKRKLIKIINNIIKDFSAQYDLKAVVFACNTLSSVAENNKKLLKLNLPYFFISPQIYLNKFNKKNTLIMCTNATYKYSKKLKKLKQQNFDYIYFKPFKTLAKMIEENSNDLTNIQSYLNKKLSSFKEIGIENVVLGCTHFTYIKDNLKIALGCENLNFFEDSKNLATRIRDVLKINGSLNVQNNKE